MKKGICPFFEIKTVAYCKASPIKKMIPVDKVSSTKGLCNEDHYEDCSFFREASGSEKEMHEIRNFTMRSSYYFHPRHLWVSLGKNNQNEAKVGIDDFAQRIIGKIESISFPSKGKEFKENEVSFLVHSNGRTVKFVMPVNGIIKEVNEDLKSSPSLINERPYDEGWILTIQLTENGIKELFYGSCAKNWLNWEVERLYRVFSSDLGITINNGGEAISDFGKKISKEQWNRLISNFL